MSRPGCCARPRRSPTTRPSTSTGTLRSTPTRPGRRTTASRSTAPAVGGPRRRPAPRARQARGLQRRRRGRVVRDAAHAAAAQGLLRRGPEERPRAVGAHRGRRRVPPLPDVHPHDPGGRRADVRPGAVDPRALEALQRRDLGPVGLRDDPRGRGGPRPAPARAGRRPRGAAAHAPGQQDPHHGGGAPRLLRPRRGCRGHGGALAPGPRLPPLRHRVRQLLHRPQPHPPRRLRVGGHRPEARAARGPGQPALPGDDPLGGGEILGFLDEADMVRGPGTALWRRAFLLPARTRRRRRAAAAA